MLRLKVCVSNSCLSPASTPANSLHRTQSTTFLRSFASSARRFDTESSASSSSAPLSPKIAPLVDQISTLSLLEVSELVTALKTKLNITEVAMPTAAAPAAGAGAGAAPVEEVEKPKEKTIFTVKLEKFEATAKAKIIREVKAIMPNMNLVEVSPVSHFVHFMRRVRYLGPEGWLADLNLGKEVCRVGAANLEGEPTKGRGRKATKDLDGSRSHHLALIIYSCVWERGSGSVSHASFTPTSLSCLLGYHLLATGPSSG